MKIIVTSPSFSKNIILQDRIKSCFADVKLNLDGTRLNNNKLIEFIGDADGVIVGLESIDEKVLSQCKNLKIISKYGVGLDNIDLGACKKKGVTIGWTGGVNSLSVAELTLGYMLMLMRNIYTSSIELKGGIWNKVGGVQLSGKTVGIIGVGHVGKRLIKLLEPFKCKILVNDVVEQKDYYQKNRLIAVEKNIIYEQADIVTIHTPLNDSTRSMVGQKEFRMMKETSFLINTARGGIVNEYDLKISLTKGDIAGAALDVYAMEPPHDKELLCLDNLICTPHIGGSAHEAVLSMGFNAIEHLRSFFE